MKKISFFLEDEQYSKLMEQKNGLTWVDFVMQLSEGELIKNRKEE